MTLTPHLTTLDDSMKDFLLWIQWPSEGAKTRGQWPYMRAGKKRAITYNQLNPISFFPNRDALIRVRVRWMQTRNSFNIAYSCILSVTSEQPRRLLLTLGCHLIISTITADVFSNFKVSLFAKWQHIITEVEHQTPSFIPRILPEWGITERRATQPARKNYLLLLPSNGNGRR